MFEDPRRINGKLNAQVLVLNQSYEPLSVCNIKKAVILLLLQKAELISKNLERMIRTVNDQYDWPSVIRLKRYVPIQHRHVILTRKNILRRDEYKCAYCGKSDGNLTIDHIVPKSKGGKDTWDNLIAACTVCNNKKGNRSPSEAGLKLLYKPYTPSHLLFLKNSVSSIDDNWKPFLYLS